MNEQWILTAGHCCAPSSKATIAPSTVSFEIGTTKDRSCGTHPGQCNPTPTTMTPTLTATTESSTTDGLIFNATKIVLFKKYNKRGGAPRKDYCLVKVDGDMLDNDLGLTPVTLPAAHLLPDLALKSEPIRKTRSNCWVVGWGTTETGKQSEDLLKTKVQVYSDQYCLTTGYTKNDHPVKSDGRFQFCAGSTSGKNDSCQGDSGGPLFCYGDDLVDGSLPYFQYGIVSFGRACGSAGAPGMYAKISMVAKWIQKVCKQRDRK